MKFTSTLVTSVVAAFMFKGACADEGFAPVEGQHGHLTVVNDDEDTNGTSVIISSTEAVSSVPHVTKLEISRGHFQLLNTGLNFLGEGKDEKVWQVSVGRKKYDGFPVMEMTQTKIAQQKGFSVRGGYLSGPGGVSTFFICSNSDYPNGNIIVWRGDSSNKKEDSAPPSTICVTSKLRWNPIMY